MPILILLLAAFTAASAQHRIVSTAPAITETLFALGLGSRVVAVSTYCHFPPEAATRPKIGTYLQPNIEAIVRLKPDLIIVEHMAPATVALLKSSGAAVAEITTGDLKTNLRMIGQIAAAAGAASAGAALTSRIEADLNQIRQRTATRPKRRVLFIVGRTPGRLEGIVAVGKGSYLNELLSIAGGANLLADSAISYPKVSLEAVIRLKPDVIIDMGEMAETQGVTEEQKRAVVDLWKKQPGIHARVHAVASDIFVVPGPRMSEAAREFERLIHGADSR